MQQGPRGPVMQTTMQHTPMVQHQHPNPQEMSSFPQVMVNGQFSYDPRNEENRQFIEHHRIQGGQQQIQRPQMQPREVKAAAQRALGVAAGQQHLGGQQNMGVHPGLMSAATGPPVRSVPVAGGQMYVDAQGRPVNMAAWQAGPQMVANTAGVPMTQAQIHAQQQQQNIILQNQYAQQQFFQQQQAQQQQQQQLQAQQQQQLQQRPLPIGRPPHPQQAQHQSPALLQVPPPAMKRTGTGLSRTSSPHPTGVRPPASVTSQQVPLAATPMPSMTQQLPLRSSTAPLTIPSPAINTPIPVAGGSQQLSVPVESKIKSESPVVHLTRKSLAAAANHADESAQRLQRLIDNAQIELEKVLKQQAEVKNAAQGHPSQELKREQFDDHVLDYLQRAGYEKAADHMRAQIRSHSSPEKGRASPVKAIGNGHLSPSALQHDCSSPRDDSAGDTSGELSMELRTPAAESPLRSAAFAMTSSQDNAKSQINGQTPRHNGTASPTKTAIKDESVTPSLFGGKPNGVSPESSAGLEKTQDGDVEMSSAKVKSPLAMHGPNEPKDLGYLYSWWEVFEDAQTLARNNQLAKSPVPVPGPAQVSTAIVPTSAMAARIAISSPSAAVRASSMGPAPVMPASVNGLPQVDAQPAMDHTNIVALQQAEEMRRRQQAQIGAQMEATQRQQAVAMGRPMPIGGPRQHLVMANGQQVSVSPEEYQQMLVQQQMHEQQQRFAQQQAQQHAQAQAQHAQQQQQQQAMMQAAQARSATPNSASHQYHPAPPMLVQIEEGQSPVTDGSLKRALGASPVDGPAKRAKLSGKKPTPEEHQRQAREVAQRVRQEEMPAPPGVPQMIMPGQVMNRVNSNTQINGNRVVSDAERIYAQNQVNYIKQQVAASPAALAMSPAQMGLASPLNTTMAQSPVVYEAQNTLSNPGSRPGTGRGKGRGGKNNSSLTIDSEPSQESIEAAPSTGASATKRKVTGKKAVGRPPGPGKGKGGKGAKARTSEASSDDLTPIDGTFSVNVTPVNPTSALHDPDQATPQAQQRLFNPQNLTFGNSSNGDNLSAEVPNHQNFGGFNDVLQMNGPQEVNDDVLLQALGDFGQDQPYSASALMFENSTFDFDFSTANFGGDDSHNDWLQPDALNDAT